MDDNEIFVALFECGAETAWRVPQLNAKSQCFQTCRCKKSTIPLLWRVPVSDSQPARNYSTYLNNVEWISPVFIHKTALAPKRTANAVLASICSRLTTTRTPRLKATPTLEPHQFVEIVVTTFGPCREWYILFGCLGIIQYTSRKLLPSSGNACEHASR